MNTRLPDADGTHRLGVPPYAEPRVVVDPPADVASIPTDLFAPAAADPSQVRRFPHDVEVSREELGILEAGSPIRAYLNRHAAEALVEREHAEARLQDATRDLEAAVRRQQMIQSALDELGALEDERGRLARVIVGPERRD